MGVAKIFFWPNYYFGEVGISTALDMIMETAKGYAVSEIAQILAPQPFTSCSCCGELEAPDLSSGLEYKRLVLGLDDGKNKKEAVN